ncbi:hypothetical protein [Noviherbaspirillum saxi]|uniref:Uncharacterized protein n=1 Tax=Noviherbaspirillum saxi TaxID=2320863 RepID=A0A3A3FGJ5_9BURK|nr:hypothetical protein [Noviherbaspirillum saxi]RJF92300.1 hypothetical protein D3871_27125 [Noviherbaspirillum saxi]
MDKHISELQDKIDVSRIVIERADGISAQARVSTMQAANHLLESWADNAPETGEEVCEVRIVFEDGLQYRSQFRLNRSLKRISLARHVRRELSALTTPKRRKGHSDDQTLLIAPATTTLAESARRVLDCYDI